MPLTSQRRKTELSLVLKRGSTVRMLAFLHRALLDPDCQGDERAQYERTLRHLTSKHAVIETETATKEESDPFA
jgi:hypothetical protein